MSEIYVEIVATKGSAPRNAGTAMKVTLKTTQGTIGGGALEHCAIACARGLIADDAPEMTRTYALGPNLGQCCGGSVKLRYTRAECVTDKADFDILPVKSHCTQPADLWLWGAGHVGRAVVHAALPQPFKITWIDDALDRFPDRISKDVSVIPTADMPLLASRAPVNTHHLIFTYSHDIDLALCAALSNRRAASIGVIGSDTKWARFSRKLRDMGLAPGLITCPIGDKSLGKTPAAIAHGTVAQLLAHTQGKITA